MLQNAPNTHKTEIREAEKLAVVKPGLMAFGFGRRTVFTLGS